MPFKAKNNREAVVVCAIHVVKRPSKRSVLVILINPQLLDIFNYENSKYKSITLGSYISTNFRHSLRF